MIYPKVEFPFANADSSRLFLYPLTLCLLLFANIARADEVIIKDAKITCQNQTCRVDVTLEHNDTGWEHYADSWRIVTETGEEIGKRVLLHPHVNEQPFTRSLNDVSIPEGVETLWIEAHDSVHGISNNKFRLDL